MIDLTKLSAAKLWLISAPTGAAESSAAPRDLPYLSSALYAVVPIATDQVPTMSVDEYWRLYVNPDWYISATVSEIGAELIHLVWHLLNEHTDRARSLKVDASTAHAWKQASDLTIRATLDPDDLAPNGMPDLSESRLPVGLSTEEYYAMLSGLPVSTEQGPGELEPSEGCGSGCDGIRRSHELPPDMGAGLPVPEQIEIRKRVAIEYLQHAKTRGDRPGEAWRWASQLLEPTIAWEPLLNQAVRRAVGWAAGRGDYTYSRPSRRAHGVRRIILPGTHRPMPKVAMVIDTSASVDDHLLGRALGEVDGALSALGISGADVTVYSCDAAVHTVQQVRKARDVRLAGGGGTDLRVGLAAVEMQRPRPDVVVVFTDGETPWPPEPPVGSSVVVALLGRPKTYLPPTPPWAIRIECLVE